MCWNPSLMFSTQCRGTTLKFADSNLSIHRCLIIFLSIYSFAKVDSLILFSKSAFSESIIGDVMAVMMAIQLLTFLIPKCDSNRSSSFFHLRQVGGGEEYSFKITGRFEWVYLLAGRCGEHFGISAWPWKRAAAERFTGKSQGNRLELLKECEFHCLVQFLLLPVSLL